MFISKILGWPASQANTAPAKQPWISTLTKVTLVASSVGLAGWALYNAYNAPAAIFSAALPASTNLFRVFAQPQPTCADSASSMLFAAFVAATTRTCPNQANNLKPLPILAAGLIGLSGMAMLSRLCTSLIDDIKRIKQLHSELNSDEQEVEASCKEENIPPPKKVSNEAPWNSNSFDITQKSALEFLGFSQLPSPDELRAKFRKLSHQLHPDRSCPQQRPEESKAAFEKRNTEASKKFQYLNACHIFVCEIITPAKVCEPAWDETPAPSSSAAASES